MTQSVKLFEINTGLDRRALAAEFARNGRLQVRDLLTRETALEIQAILARGTRWGFSWQAGGDGPHHWRQARAAAATQAEIAAMRDKLSKAVQAKDFAFLYLAYPLLDAYLEKWDPGSPHELLLEHLNDAPFLDLMRTITGIPGLKKADGQATLYGPGHFLTEHNDSHAAHGRRVAYVLNLTIDGWQADWGGNLLFFNETGDVSGGFVPRFNALSLFAVPQLHAVSYVPPFSPLGRYAITGWLYDD
jgi:SM-20-related protein